jgi:hypothetical protein
MHPSSIKHPRIAFTGYSRSGKDVAGSALVEMGYVRHNFGDIIKRQLDALLQTHLGISAFTEQDDQKWVIRPLLELWGDLNYEEISTRYFDYLPKRCVNTRLVRLREGFLWRNNGGLIVLLTRPGLQPASSWEEACLGFLEADNLITHRLTNDGTPEELAQRVVQLARGEL